VASLPAARDLTEELAASLAKGIPCGLSTLNRLAARNERYLVAFPHAVQISGLGARIGMGETPEIASRKVMSALLRLPLSHRRVPAVVDLETLKAHEWECLTSA